MLALGEPLMSRSPLANVLLRDGDGVPGTHKVSASRCWLRSKSSQTEWCARFET
jgi:hypothetical protein